MKSTEFLQAAIDVQAERGKQYDKPTGERSMGATISAFNCITGYTLEESDGWMLLSLLKLVRQSQNPEQYHHDSALDFVAYASLYAEAASEQCGQLEAQQAAEPSHIISDIPSWDLVDSKHQWIAQDRNGSWFSFLAIPRADARDEEWYHLDYTHICSGEPNEDWQDTLIPRPTSTAK